MNEASSGHKEVIKKRKSIFEVEQPYDQEGKLGSSIQRPSVFLEIDHKERKATISSLSGDKFMFKNGNMDDVEKWHAIGRAIVKACGLARQELSELGSKVTLEEQ